MPSPSSGAFVQRVEVEFTWSPGMSTAQRQRSIVALHAAARRLGCERILEISTKSPEALGTALSAFNLSFESKKNRRRFVVESVFQGSKVFENGGPFIDLYTAPAKEAKRDARLRTSGKLVQFCFFKENWPTLPLTAFYDWLYTKSLVQHPQLAAAVLDYDGFSDIEFNPDKSINCQAQSAALFCSLHRRNLLTEAIGSKEAFLSVISSFVPENAHFALAS